MESVIIWNDVDEYFTERNFHHDDIQKKFVNQIRVKTINNNPTDPTKQNQVDTGIQYSVFGPKIFAVYLLLNFQALDSSLEFIKNKGYLPPAFTKSSNTNNIKLNDKIRINMNTKGKVNSNIRHGIFPSKWLQKIIILGR